MKIEELRIGNWVNNPKNQGSQKVHKITPFKDTYFVNEYAIEFFRRIPITAEWLQRFGFWSRVDKPLCFYQSEWDLNLFNRLDGQFGVYYGVNLLSTIRYVHELQNLFMSLSGEELEIKE